MSLTPYRSRIPIESAIFNINKIPPANVKEERQGEWKHDEIGCFCTCCNVHNDDDAGKAYCPNCGAKMDLGGIE